MPSRRLVPSRNLSLTYTHYKMGREGEQGAEDTDIAPLL